MKKGRLLSTVAILLAASLTLSACGSSSKETTSETASSTAETTTTVAEPAAEVTTIVAATGGQPKPYVFVNENNEPDGYDTELIKLVFDKLPQYELKIEVTDFSSIFTGLTAGNYQIGFNSFTYNDERAKSYLYSYPYDLNAYVIVQKEDATAIESFKDLAGKTLEAGASGAIANGVEKWNEDHPDAQITINYTEADTTTLLTHVVDGVTEFTIMDPAMFKVYTEDFGITGLQATALDEESTLFISENLNAYFLFPLDQEDLRAEVNEVVKELHDDGTIATLTQKWFGRELVPDASQYEKTLN